MKQRHLKPEDYRKLLKYLDAQPTEPMIVAMQTILRTGCRTEELLKLNAECINRTNDTITILPAKGSETRYIPLSKAMIKSIGDLLTLHGSFASALSEGSESSAKRAIRRAWKSYVFRALGLGYGHTSPHSARSSFAINIYLKMNNDVLLVQELLGHKALSSTEHYVKMSRSLEMAHRLKRVIG